MILICYKISTVRSAVFTYFDPHSRASATSVYGEIQSGSRKIALIRTLRVQRHEERGSEAGFPVYQSYVTNDTGKGKWQTSFGKGGWTVLC